MRFSKQDTVSYPLLMEGLRAVRDTCVDEENPGWIQMGEISIAAGCLTVPVV